jgi:excisionase family DNA binding protein
VTLESGLRAMIAEIVREELARALAELARPDEYLSPRRAAQLADVAPATIRRWIREGRLASTSAGRAIRVCRSELERFLRRDGRSHDDLTPEAAAARDFPR